MEDETTLDDVVVIGYGTVKKRNLTAAMATKGITTASIKDDSATRMKNIGGLMASHPRTL